MANEAHPARAEGGANGHLALARGGAHQQNVGDVEASHQENESGQSHKGERDGRERIVGIGFGTSKLFGKGTDGDTFVGIRMLLGEALGDNIEGSLSILQLRSRLEPGHQ